MQLFKAMGILNAFQSWSQDLNGVSIKTMLKYGNEVSDGVPSCASFSALLNSLFAPFMDSLFASFLNSLFTSFMDSLFAPSMIALSCAWLYEMLKYRRFSHN